METKKINAEEDYITTPISVLSYISELEQQTTSQQQTIERYRNVLLKIREAAGIAWYNDLFKEAEQLLNTTEPIDR